MGNGSNEKKISKGVQKTIKIKLIKLNKVKKNIAALYRKDAILRLNFLS